MEGEQRHYGLRSASRSPSRTPLVQMRALVEPEIVDHQYDLRIRSREGSDTSSDIIISKRGGSNIKTYEQHQNMENIAGSKKEVVITSSEDEHKKAESSFTSTKKSERKSERQNAKKHVFANGQTENKTNLIGRNILKGKKNVSEEQEREDSLSRANSAHEIYQQAGDWWNIFPKTDYTYSETSQCRYEIAPGILAMPNMSRRSIHSNSEECNEYSLGQSKSGEYEAEDIGRERRARSESHTVQQMKTHVEQHYCHREIIYSMPQVTQENSGSRQRIISDTPLKRITPRKYDITSSPSESDAELQEAVSKSHSNNGQTKLSQYFISFTSILATWIYDILQVLKLKTVKRREYRASSEYERYGQKEFRIWRRLDRLLHYVYLFMVKALLFDTWLLSRVSTIRRSMGQRISKVLWIAILPLLLLAGTYIVQKQSFIRLDSLHNVP